MPMTCSNSIARKRSYTLAQLNGLIRCECGCKYWEQRDAATIVCSDCGDRAPTPPETTRARVKSDFTYVRMMMNEATSIFTSMGRSDDPRLGASIDIDRLTVIANELSAAASTLSQYVAERGGSL